MDKDGLMFPKQQKRKKHRRHPKSILQDKADKKCYLCILMEDDWSTYPCLEEHHIFFSKHQRALSEQYGLKVYLCPHHHRIGPLAVHNNQKCRRKLEAKGQQAFEALYGHERFMEVFGENYL